MKGNILGVLVALLAGAGVGQAQEWSVVDRVVLGTAQCTLRTGSGSPESVVTGSICDTYWDSGAGRIYRKLSGTATTTGWVIDTTAIGTTGTLPKWTGAGVLGNSVVVESSGKIGINTTPSQTLHVQANADAGAQIVVENTNGGANASSSLRTLEDIAATSYISHSSGRTITRYGITLGGYNEILASTGNGLIIGTNNATPVIFGTNNTEVMRLASAGNLTLSPVGDLITNPAGKDILPNVAYDIAIGSATLQYKTLDVAELHAQTLVAQDVIATIGGMIVVAPTTQLVALLGGAATTIHVKHNEIASGDRILLKSSPGGVPQFEVMAVTSGAGGSAGDYTYTVTRNLDGSGADTWQAGDAVVNTGTTGDGLIELFSTGGLFGGNGPSIIGQVRLGSTYNDIAARWGVGNLNGYCGYSSTIYGAFFGDCSNTNVTIDATNGFRIRSGVTNKFLADTSGNLTLLTGAITLNTNGVTLAAATGGTTYSAANGYKWSVANGSDVGIAVNQNSGDHYVVFEADNVTTAKASTITIRAENSTDVKGSVLTLSTNSALLSSPTSSAFTVQGEFAVGPRGGGANVLLVNSSTGATRLDGKFGLSVTTTHQLELSTDDAVKPTTNTWTIASDAATKEHIVPYRVDALDLIRQVRIREFDYTGEYGQPKVHGIGPIAHEIAALFPRSVSTTLLSRVPGAPPEPIQLFNAHELWMTNVQAVIELDRQVQQLAAEVAALKQKGGGQ